MIDIFITAAANHESNYIHLCIVGILSHLMFGIVNEALTTIHDWTVGCISLIQACNLIQVQV